jgi:endoglucanase
VTIGFLTAAGPRLVDGTGRSVVLRGVNLGGWMNWEGFLLGHPATEKVVRTALRQALGPDRYLRLTERLLDSFYGEADAAYLASLGFNCVRIPLNYRHFEDDAEPFTLKPDGFRHLDRAIAANARHGIYSIVDLHAAQGWQNHGWYSDNQLCEILTWDHPHFRERIIWLRQQFAEHYRDEPWVAGYNLLNEPDDVSRRTIGPFYRRLIETIRGIDPKHLIFLDDNTSAPTNFEELGVAEPGIVYSAHLYPVIGAAGPVPYPGVREGKLWDRAAVDEEFLDRTAWVRERESPLFVGEFGPVDEGDETLFASRMELPRDQLRMYSEHGATWTFWTYKDVGVSGLVRVGPESAWIRRLGAAITKKRRLAGDIWGTRPELAREVQGTFADLLDSEFPEDRWKPWGTAARAWQLVGQKLIGELIVEDFVSCFAGLTDAELDALADSWLFDNCNPKAELAAVLATVLATAAGTA